MKSYKELKAKSDSFFELCNSIIETKPWLVIISMHEYFRNLYPDDPYITFPKKLCPTERLYLTIENLLSLLNSGQSLGHYSINFDEISNQNDEVKVSTGKVYGQLWSKFSFEELTNEAKSILNERFEKNGYQLNFSEYNNAIDIGCGSGRFTLALKKLGCQNVTGVDYGDQGLKIAKQTMQELNISNVTFKKTNVLELPFENESFDFIYCNGVLHHTENMELATKEMIRIAKKGALIWFYLYGDGGIFWYARKEMPKIMKKIPQEYTVKVLEMIGMPSKRFIFCDNWYVPIERHSTDNEVQKILTDLCVTNIKRLKKGRTTDLEQSVFEGGEAGKIMWGDGDLRYILQK